MHRPRTAKLSGIAALTGLTLIATGCATSGSTTPASSDSATAASASRIAVSYEGGIAVLDASTLEVVDEFDTEAFTRLNAAGDGQHVIVTTSEGFQFLDTETPELTDVIVPASAGGHVVRHAGNTVLFDDGTGTTTILDTDALSDPAAAIADARTYTAEEAHHGVSIVLEDGTLLTTVGTEDSRSGAAAFEEHEDHWHELSISDQCPGIHGEGTAADEAVIFGCEDGALLYQDGEFTKLDAPDAYGRMGNAYVTESSPIVVGDYKNDPDAEGYLLHAVTLIDTTTQSYEVVDLPDTIEYTFRDVTRGDDGAAYILSTDGSIHVLDPETGEIVNEFPVVEPWEGPVEWQDAHPAIVSDGEVAYVTEPAANAIHLVDLASGEITNTVELDHVPNEIAIALG